MFERKDLKWDGWVLKRGKRMVATIIPDPDWPKMYRMQMPGSHVTDMVKQAAH